MIRVKGQLNKRYPVRSTLETSNIFRCRMRSWAVSAPHREAVRVSRLVPAAREHMSHGSCANFSWRGTVADAEASVVADADARLRVAIIESKP